MLAESTAMVGEDSRGYRLANPKQSSPHCGFHDGAPRRRMEPMNRIMLIEQFQVLDNEPRGFQLQSERLGRIGIDVSDFQRFLECAARGSQMQLARNLHIDEAA